VLRKCFLLKCSETAAPIEICDKPRKQTEVAEKWGGLSNYKDILFYTLTPDTNLWKLSRFAAEKSWRCDCKAAKKISVKENFKIKFYLLVSKTK